MFGNQFGIGMYIFLSHCKAYKSDFGQIILFEIISPVVRDIASFNDQVLVIFDRCLNDLSYDRPQIRRKLVIVLGSKQSLAAPDKAHLQMIYGHIREAMLFEQSLCENGLARMRCACDENDHFNRLKSINHPEVQKEYYDNPDMKRCPNAGYNGADDVLDLFFSALILPALFAAEDKTRERYQP